MNQFGAYLAALRSHASLSQTELAQCVDSSRSSISRVESGEVPLPFKGVMRRLVIALGELLCSTTQETERFMQLAKLEKSLLTDGECIQLGVPFAVTKNLAEARERADIYRELLTTLEQREKTLGTRRTPQQLKAKIQEYSNIIGELEARAARLQGHPEVSKSVKVLPSHTSNTLTGKLIVGREQGQMSSDLSKYNLLDLASEQARSLMDLADVDCFAIDDCICIAQSRDFKGWDASEIEATLLSTPITIPHDLDELRQSKIGDIAKDYTNGRHYRLVSFTPSFGDPDSLKVTLAPINFFDYYSLTCYFDEPLLKDANGKAVSIRQKYGNSALTYMSAERGTSLIPTPISLQCVVMTADEQILMSRRSALVAFYPNHWSASFEETMNAYNPDPTNKAERNIDQNFTDGILRGLDEEFAIKSEQVENITVLSLNVEYLTLSVDVIAVIRLNLSSDAIRQSWLLGAWDKNEASKMQFIPGKLESIVEKLFEPHMLWHPTSRMRLIQFLFSHYSIELVGKKLQELKNREHMEAS